MHIVLNTFYLSPGGRGETWACLFRQQQLLFLDGVYIDDANKEKQSFHPVVRHKTKDLVSLTHKISLRIARYLERSGLIERDAENSYLSADATDEVNDHQLYSISYRISIGPHKGRKVFSLQTVPPIDEGEGRQD